MTEIWFGDDAEELKDCTLIELCQLIKLDELFITQCVEYGIAQVAGRQTSDWTFQAPAVVRIQKAWRLQRDLDIHISGLPLILELLDEREALQYQVAVLQHKLRGWEE